eukprot:1156756-Pelagomonas_calceolata.AAC.6
MERSTPECAPLSAPRLTQSKGCPDSPVLPKPSFRLTHVTRTHTHTHTTLAGVLSASYYMPLMPGAGGTPSFNPSQLFGEQARNKICARLQPALLCVNIQVIKGCNTTSCKTAASLALCELLGNQEVQLALQPCGDEQQSTSDLTLRYLCTAHPVLLMHSPMLLLMLMRISYKGRPVEATESVSAPVNSLGSMQAC